MKRSFAYGVQQDAPVQAGEVVREQHESCRSRVLGLSYDVVEARDGVEEAEDGQHPWIFRERRPDHESRGSTEPALDRLALRVDTDAHVATYNVPSTRCTPMKLV